MTGETLPIDVLGNWYEVPVQVQLHIISLRERLAALAELEKAEAVYLVATGETYEGAETYTRHDVAPALCDCEKLYAAPVPPKENGK